MTALQLCVAVRVDAVDLVDLVDAVDLLGLVDAVGAGERIILRVRPGRL